jgi:hypothetical protein
MSDFCFIHFVTSKNNIDDINKLAEELESFAETRGWFQIEKNVSNSSIGRMFLGLNKHKSFWGADLPQTFGAGTNLSLIDHQNDESLYLIEFNIVDRLFMGCFSKNHKEQEKTNEFIKSLLSFTKDIILSVNPRYAVGDTEYTFPMNKKIDEPITPSEEQMLNLFKKGIIFKKWRPWLVYLDSELVSRIGRNAIDNYGKLFERDECSNGILLFTRENPFIY